MKTCCFTGHRNVPQEAVALLQKEVDELLRMLVTQGVDCFYCGGARGFDLLAGERVLALKDEIPSVRLWMILPCKNQNKYWSAADQASYERILKAADGVDYVSEAYTAHCMHERNARLIALSDACICYCKRLKSGSAYTVFLAAKKNRKIFPVGLTETERTAFETTFGFAQQKLEEYFN